MPQYQYKAKNSEGKAVTGTINAQNETDAVSELRRQGFVILGLNAKRGGGGNSPGFFSLSVGGRGKNIKLSSVSVKSNDMVVFTRQLSTMISAGIPVV